MDFEFRNTGEWVYLCLPSLEEKGIRHGFFGKASPPYNPGEEGREEFLSSFALHDTCAMKQEHGDTFHVVADGVRPDRGDALILVERGVAGIIRTADCLPVIIADPEYPMAAIVHAGWRGTAKKIVSKVVQGMRSLGAEQGRLVALLGPSIGPCCYEVKEDVREVFTEKGFPEGIFSRRDGSLFLDIRAANAALLSQEGVLSIHDTCLCTYCRNDTFASFRRGEKEARQVNFVSLSDRVY
jgi:polyphenol oxidase